MSIMRTHSPSGLRRRGARLLALPAIALAALAGSALMTASPASAHTVAYFDGSGVFHLTVDAGDGLHRDLDSNGGDSGFYYYYDNRP
jgi:hypothetical protein